MHFDEQPRLDETHSALLGLVDQGAGVLGLRIQPLVTETA